VDWDSCRFQGTAAVQMAACRNHRTAAAGRGPTAIHGLQFRYQRSWKGLVRYPKAADRMDHGTDTCTVDAGWQALPESVHILMIDVASTEELPEDFDGFRILQLLRPRRDTPVILITIPIWSVAFYLDLFSRAAHPLPAGTMTRANGAPNPPTAQAPMPAPVPCASNRSGCWMITVRPISPTSSADVSPATGAAR
jgi:hypothetical protein